MKHRHVLFSFVWGIIWAVFHHFTPVGWFILTKQTWLAVVIGCGGNLLIGYPFMERESWLRIAQIFAGSAIAVGFRSLAHQASNQQKEVDAQWQRLHKSGISDLGTTSKQV